MQITVNLTDPRASSIALDEVIFSKPRLLSPFNVSPATESLVDGLSAALLTPQGETLAHAIISASEAVLDTSTVECYEYTKDLPIEAARGAYLVIGEYAPIAIIPVQVARNVLADLAPPTSVAPSYPTRQELVKLLIEMDNRVSSSKLIMDEAKRIAGTVEPAVNEGLEAINEAVASGAGAIESLTKENLGEIDTVKTNALTAIGDAKTNAETSLQGKVDAATESIEQSTETAANAATAAGNSATAAATSASNASASATAASGSATQAATSATEAEAAAAEINQQAASIGFLLVKPGCPINIEERNGAICQVRCMGENRFMPACDGVYYSVTSSTKTYFLDKDLNIVKVFNKTFGRFSYHDYINCGSGTLIVRDGLIWYTTNNLLYVADWETGNILASLGGYNSVVHNGLSGHIVAIADNGLTAVIATYDAENNAIIVSATYDTGLPFTATENCRVHPYHMGKFTLVHLMRTASFFGTKIYALNSADVFEEVSADVDGDPILFNCTATAAGHSGDEYTNQYASKNPGFYWTGKTFTDSEGGSHQAFTMTNGLRIWVTSGTTTEGVPVFAKFNHCYGNYKGLVFGYPWQGVWPNARIPVAISCGCRSSGGYFYGGVLSGDVARSIYTPYTLKPSIPFAQTSSGGTHSSASLQETKASNIVAIYPVAPLRGAFSFGGNWGYSTTTPGMLIDLRQPLV